MRGLLCTLLASSAALYAQPSLFDELYGREDTVVISLDTRWKHLLRHRKDKEYQPADVVIGDTRFPARVRSRGHARLEQCALASLKVKLGKEALREAGYPDSLNDLKVVVQCAANPVGESYLRRERLVYELHRIVSEYHHRTVPTRLVVPGGDTLHAFLIETEEQLEARYNARLVEIDYISTRGLDRATYLNLCLFNYLVLNTDFNVFNRHNVECLSVDGGRSLVVIPYDFDYSGFVGTSYAVPHEGHDIRSVYEPKFLGRHVTLEELQAAREIYRRAEADLRQKISTATALREAHRRRLLRRLEEFYDSLEDDRQLEKLVTDR